MLPPSPALLICHSHITDARRHVWGYASCTFRCARRVATTILSFSDLSTATAGERRGMVRVIAFLCRPRAFQPKRRF